MDIAYMIYVQFNIFLQKLNYISYSKKEMFDLNLF